MPYYFVDIKETEHIEPVCYVGDNQAVFDQNMVDMYKLASPNKKLAEQQYNPTKVWENDFNIFLDLGGRYANINLANFLISHGKGGAERIKHGYDFSRIDTFDANGSNDFDVLVCEYYMQGKMTRKLRNIVHNTGLPKSTIEQFYAHLDYLDELFYFNCVSHTIISMRYLTNLRANIDLTKYTLPYDYDHIASVMQNSSSTTMSVIAMDYLLVRHDPNMEAAMPLESLVLCNSDVRNMIENNDLEIETYQDLRKEILNMNFDRHRTRGSHISRASTRLQNLAKLEKCRRDVENVV